MTTDWKRLIEFAASRAGAPLALTTLMRREGASYRQPGARLLSTARGEYAGCLSGGCLEEGVAQVGIRVLRERCGERLSLDTRPHFGCPGTLDLWVEPVLPAVLTGIATALEQRRRLWIKTRPDATGTRLLDRCPDRVSDLAAKDEGIVAELDLLPRLLVVGAASDGDPLAELGRWLGWDVQRVVHSAETPAPAGKVVPPEALATTYPSDDRTACVVMTHHLGRDFAYLREALAAGYPYVGLLGSRRRRETLLAELGEAGALADDTITRRLHAPVGLDLGAEDPHGIALAIVAEIQAAWTGATARPLRGRAGAVHGGRGA